MPHHLLIDVRSPSEFSTGHLSAPDISPPTLNIEYTSISLLPNIISQTLHFEPSKEEDEITLYCRSGRRSNIALQTLKEMGFRNVRDIGGWEEAKRVLDREIVERQLEEEMGLRGGEGEEKEGGKGKKGRVESFGALVEGLKALEG